MLVDERIRVAAMSLGQVDQERQKPGKRGWHGIDQIIHRVAFIAGPEEPPSKTSGGVGSCSLPL